MIVAYSQLSKEELYYFKEEYIEIRLLLNKITLEAEWQMDGKNI